MSVRTVVTMSLVFATLLGCAEAMRHSARVELSIDGARFDYQTAKAQVELPARGVEHSIYLLPDEPDAGNPYVCLRSYAGNPVRELWLRWRGPADDDAELRKFRCYVPGKLSDGRDTLSWTKDDGSARDKNETGEPDCSATVSPEGDKLRFTFAADLSAAGAKKKKGKGASAGADEAAAGAKVRIEGSALVELKAAP